VHFFKSLFVFIDQVLQNGPSTKLLYTSRIWSNLKKETSKTRFADLYSLCTKPDPELTFSRSLEPDSPSEAQNTAFCKICEIAVIF
jgi:hypothetical protein